MLRYGVFNLGQLWCVVAAEGAQLGFPDRTRALDAAGLICKAHRACGENVELLVQDGVGRVSRMSDGPEEEGLLKRPEELDEPVLLRMRPRAVSLRLVS
ncbi:MAG TPA: hypothetical protein VGC92_07270 [Phenylobacterium sp.]|jgi:hypothetical protein